jgi:F1F0 ATPase subunit 2
MSKTGVTMIDGFGLVFNLALTLVAGILLGAIFFGGLWWTVRKGVTAKHPALWFLGSMLLRTGIALVGFYFVMGDDWRKLLLSLLGFVIMRSIVIRLSRMATKNQDSLLEPRSPLPLQGGGDVSSEGLSGLNEETSHAP